MSRIVQNFADLKTFYAEAVATPEFQAAFGDVMPLSIIELGDEPVEHDMPEPIAAQADCAGIVATIFDLLTDTRLEPLAPEIAWGIVNSFHFVAGMPDALQMQVGVEMLVTTLFDLLRDTRLEAMAERLAWGIVHSFHKVAEQVDTQADHASRGLDDLIRENDGGEVATHEIEERQLLCHGLDEAREALSCMRDHAAAMFHAETGRPWSAPRATLVSGKRTASVIAAQDFLAARRRRRIEQNAPTGPVVLFSGGKSWEDHALIWDRLDTIRTRIPMMILATTAQDKGCDAIAAAWAARSGVAVVNFALDRRLGMRAGFARNETMMRLKPVEAMICEGSGLQSHMARLAREAGVPAHFFALRDQRPGRIG